MDEVVIVGRYALAIGMGGIIVVATLSGLLLSWIEGRIDRSDAH